MRCWNGVEVKMPKMFTLMTCTHNHAGLLRLTIQKMLELDGLEEYVEEILVVDNASTDETAEVVRAFSAQSPLVRYLLEPQQGVTYARRHAAELSTPWLIFVDDDNLLSKNYLVRAAELIEKNPDAGVINGAGIASPLPGERFTTDEQQRLFAVAAYLACSHPGVDSFKAGMESMATVPYGAGVILRVEPLKRFSERGWTKNVGRSGEALTSGEDGEIIAAVLEEGYRYLYDSQMYFYHLMPKGRLQEDYLSRLYRGIGHGMYHYHRRGPHGRMRNFCYFAGYCLRLLFLPVVLALTGDPVKKLSYHYRAYSWKAYNRCCLGKREEDKVVSRL